MKTIKDLTGWGGYSDGFSYLKSNGYHLHGIKFTDVCGISYWRWYESRSEIPPQSSLLWNDKNAFGRKLETKYYLTKADLINDRMVKI